VPDIKPDGKDHEPVADISHHHPEEQGEEDREDGRGIELIVFSAMIRVP